MSRVTPLPPRQPGSPSRDWASPIGTTVSIGEYATRLAALDLTPAQPIALVEALQWAMSISPPDVPTVGRLRGLRITTPASPCYVMPEMVDILGQPKSQRFGFSFLPCASSVIPVGRALCSQRNGIGPAQSVAELKPLLCAAADPRGDLLRTQSVALGFIELGEGDPPRHWLAAVGASSEAKQTVQEAFDAAVEAHRAASVWSVHVPSACSAWARGRR
ncbi:hypothetical protein [Nocardioides sp.]|uniref:hypothetical protein n=1 Tax=Nocardioides sp. TaxID=35761 RepID=UPI0035118FA0